MTVELASGVSNVVMEGKERVAGGQKTRFRVDRQSRASCHTFREIDNRATVDSRASDNRELFQSSRSRHRRL